MSRKVKILVGAMAVSSVGIIFLSLPVNIPFMGCSEAHAIQGVPEPGILAVLGLAGGFGLLKRGLKRIGSGRKDR